MRIRLRKLLKRITDLFNKEEPVLKSFKLMINSNKKEND